MMLPKVRRLSSTASAAPRDPGDPLQGFNRKMYGFNDVLDRHVLKPVAKAYQSITPEFVAVRISNFFSNIGEVTVVINELLQLKFTRAASDTGRFAMNSTVGLAGLFDVAGKLGMQKLRSEYNVNCSFESVPVSTARWISCDDEKMLGQFKDKVAANLALDHAGDLVYIAPTRVNLQLAQERWPQIRFLATREHAVDAA